jgi:hypothetical protein
MPRIKRGGRRSTGLENNKLTFSLQDGFALSNVNYSPATIGTSHRHRNKLRRAAKDCVRRFA